MHKVLWPQLMSRTNENMQVYIYKMLLHYTSNSHFTYVYIKTHGRELRGQGGSTLRPRGPTPAEISYALPGNRFQNQKSKKLAEIRNHRFTQTYSVKSCKLLHTLPNFSLS